MSVTLADLVAEVEGHVYSFFNDRDKVTSLNGSVTNVATTLTVDDATQVDRGFIEVDDELMAVQSKDEGANLVTLFPWGRGQRGTVAAAHSDNARVAVNPRFPRSRIKTAINQAISGLFPELFAVATDATQTTNAVVRTYAVPAAAEGLLKVAYQAVGPEGNWVPLSRFRFDYSADTTAYATGKTVDLLEPVAPGRTLQLVYRKSFGTLASDSDTLSSIGVSDSWRDLIRLAASADLLQGTDAARTQNTSVEAGTRTDVPIGAGSALSRQLLAVYQARLAEERRLLLQRYPTSQVRH